MIIQALFQVKDTLSKGLGREASEAELAQATNQSIFQVRRQIQVGRAAKNKLIKVINIIIFLRCSCENNLVNLVRKLTVQFDSPAA